MAPPCCRNCGGLEWRRAPGTDDHGRCVACQEFPSLGFAVGDWIEANCAIPDGDLGGEPYVLTGEMWRFVLRHYRLDPFAGQDSRTGIWRLPFFYVRGSQLVRSQKWGKGPFAAAIICTEGAPDGPVRFDGWDAAGQPVGRPWATPIIQVTAASEDQADNVWGALLPMIERGALAADITDTGLTRINLPSGGKIEPVTSSSLSRLGQRVTKVVQDQTESWTQTNGLRKLADTQRRGLAGMDGRWLSTCNAWDPRDDSVAQYTAEHELDGVYHDDVDPGAGSVRNKAERRRMLKKVYGDSWWVNLDRIDAEIVALLDRDPAQAERWFLNRKIAGEDAVFDGEHWDGLAKLEYEPEAGSLVVVGVDGARFDDALAIVATEVQTGFQWPLEIIERPENAPPDYEHDFDRADGAVVDAFERFYVWRLYADEQYIEQLVDRWKGRWGEKRVIGWLTNRPRQAAWAVRNYQTAVGAGDVSHNGDETFARHIKNARKQKVNVHDDNHQRMHTMSKDSPRSRRKMDGAWAGCLSWEARGDAIAAGATAVQGPLVAWSRR